MTGVKVVVELSNISGGRRNETKRDSVNNATWIETDETWPTKLIWRTSRKGEWPDVAASKVMSRACPARAPGRAAAAQLK